MKTKTPWTPKTLKPVPSLYQFFKGTSLYLVIITSNSSHFICPRLRYDVHFETSLLTFSTLNLLILMLLGDEILELREKRYSD